MKVLSTLVAGLLLSTSAYAVDLAKYPMAFTTGDGVEIVVAPSKDGKQALVQVNGINHDIDGVVFLSDITSRGEDTQAYQFKRDGEMRALLLRQKGWGGEYYEAYLPGKGNVSLGMDEDLQKTIDLTELNKLYEQQKTQGTQDKIAQFDRQGHQTQNDKALVAKDSKTNATCENSVVTQVNWEKTTDQMMMAVSIPGYCGVVTEQLASLCASDASFKERAKSIKTINCEFGDKLKIKLDGEELNFTTSKNEPNQVEFVRSYFRNL